MNGRCVRSRSHFYITYSASDHEFPFQGLNKKCLIHFCIVIRSFFSYCYVEKCALFCAAMSSVARQEVEIKINAHHCYLLQRYFLIQILLSFYVYFFAILCSHFL